MTLPAIYLLGLPVGLFIGSLHQSITAANGEGISLWAAAFYAIGWPFFLPITAGNWIGAIMRHRGWHGR